MNLGGGDLVLNSGSFIMAQNATRDIIMQNAKLAGSGTIVVTSTKAGTVLDFTVGNKGSTTGFSGIFDVAGSASIDFLAITVADASFGMILSDSAQFINDNDTALTSLVLGGVTLAQNATYTQADLDLLGVGAYTTGGLGTITVIPEPATFGLVVAFGGLMLWVRRFMSI